MTLNLLYTQELRVEFKANFFSQATFFVVVCWALNLFLPLLLVYKSDGLWLTSETFLEQPRVSFKRDILLRLEWRDPNATKTSSFVWSSKPGLDSELDGNETIVLRAPQVSHREDDSNGDGKFDELQLKLSMPLETVEQVQSVQLLVFFDYKLKEKVKFQMETMAYIQSTATSEAATKLVVVGELKFLQKEHLMHRGHDFRFNHSILGKHNLDNSTIADVLTDYLRRNFTTRLSRDTLYLWEQIEPDLNSTNSTEFTIDLTIFNPAKTFSYRPCFWFGVKWALVQYLCVFVPFYFIFEAIKRTIFCSQVVNTIVHYPKLPSHTFEMYKRK